MKMAAAGLAAAVMALSLAACGGDTGSGSSTPASNTSSCLLYTSRLLLEQEGVAFRENGYVDLKHCRWKPIDGLSDKGG